MRRVFRSRKPGNSKQVFSECRIMNYLQTSFARVAQGNIGPRYFLDGPLYARSVLPRLQVNIPQYGSHARLVRT